MQDYQQNQKEVINTLEKQVKSNILTFSTVSPVTDFKNDQRICLTSVHIPKEDLKNKIRQTLIEPLKQISPEHFYYHNDSLHMTIKNIRIINNPPHFSNQDIEKAKKVFSKVIPKHKSFKVFFYRLLLFSNNLALMGTSGEELDNIILDLDKKLKAANIPDDKKYLNNRYFFINMTLARFSNPISEEFKKKVEEFSANINFEPYTINSVTLLTCNAVFENRNIIDTWNLNFKTPREKNYC